MGFPRSASALVDWSSTSSLRPEQGSRQGPNLRAGRRGAALLRGSITVELQDPDPIRAGRRKRALPSVSILDQGPLLPPVPASGDSLRDRGEIDLQVERLRLRHPVQVMAVKASVETMPL